MTEPRSAAHGTPQRPRPAALVTASVALHAVAAVAVVARPQVWPWALGAVAADHLLLTAAGLWPKSRLLGSNWTRLPPLSAAQGAIAITIDDGPDPDVTPQVLAMLDAHAARATFFCVGERVDRYAELAREIVMRGHAIENHSYRHLRRFSLLGPGAIAADIGRAQDSIARIAGAAPRFFRAPAGLRNPFLDPILARLQLQLASWTRRGFDTVDADAGAVLGRLTRRLQGGDILLLHDGNSARRTGGAAVILSVLPRLLAALQAGGFKPVTLRSALT